MGSVGQAEYAEVPPGEHKEIVLERPREVSGNLSGSMLDRVDS